SGVRVRDAAARGSAPGRRRVVRLLLLFVSRAMPTNAWAAAGALLSLGALHGLNPGMGWLFAVALGTQQRDRRAVWGALGPLALGHALAIAAAVAIALGLGVVLPSAGVRWGAAALRVGLGVWRDRESTRLNCA